MKQIIITCDTEIGELGHCESNAFEIFIEGKVNNQEVGYKLINSITERYGAKVEHFVDVYPFQQYGEDKFINLCNDILNSGHKLALHTHPSGKYDKNRKLMHQYSLDEQTEIINFGKNKIEGWTKSEVIAHRCGGYGLNTDTLKALYRNNILIDSSFFKNNPNCQLYSHNLNKPYQIEGVFEVPITVYLKHNSYYSFRKMTKIIKTKTMKLDFRYGSLVSDIINTIIKAPNGSVIILFLHSFNFLNLPFDNMKKKYLDISINQKFIEDYMKLLSEISQLDKCVFSTFDKLDLKKTYPEFLITCKSYSNIFSHVKRNLLDIFSIKNSNQTSI